MKITSYLRPCLCFFACLSTFLLSCAWAETYHIGVNFKAALEIPAGEDPDLTMLHRVTFDKESMDWTSLDEEFDTDDVFEIKLDEVGSIKVKIDSIEQGKSVEGGDKYFSLTGTFESGVGWAQILFINGKLCVILCDYLDNTVFHIVYNEIEDCYTIRIIEPEASLKK